MRQQRMRVAVVGGGMSGLAAAYELAKAGVEVVLYEKEEYLGGKTRAVHIDGVDLHLDFMPVNWIAHPNMTELFEQLGVELEACDMSFSISLNSGKGYEWGCRNGLHSIFAQKINLLNPFFLHMLREILKFKDDAAKYVEKHEADQCMDHEDTLEVFIKTRGYSQLFQKAYLMPMCAAIWSCPQDAVMSFSALSVLSFCRRYHFLQLFGRPYWFTTKRGSHSYINKITSELESRHCHIRLGCEVTLVSSKEKGCAVLATGLSDEVYDGCIISIRAPDAISLLGKQLTYEESRILGAFQYASSDVYLHRDISLMPHNRSSWSAWNFQANTENDICVTYWLNLLQNLEFTSKPFLATCNPPITPKHKLLKWTASHPSPSIASSKASLEIGSIQGRRAIWFCGTYLGDGFHEDGLKSGLLIAHNLLGKDVKLLKRHRNMVPSLLEAGARLVVTKFLEHYISTGSLVLLEEGGTIFSFVGPNKRAHEKATLKVHSPLFYWKIATEADMGLADSYINGYFSSIDQKSGLLDLLLVLIANRDLSNSSDNNQNKGGWWTPQLLTAGISSARYFLQHMLRSNTLLRAQRNISLHYDLSNEFFSLVLDETMTYSCAVFKSGDEDLRVAQLYKLSLLIDKAVIDASHEILEIGCGWGSLALQVVKQTGCRYTGITLSIEQLEFAKRRVEEAGLEDRITLLLCDYRQLPGYLKYDRIISCEMIEHLGDEYMEEFFGCCEEHLAEDGLCVLQFSSIPDPRYESYRKSSDFIKEYIFPGACVPSLSRITSAMAASSKLCVEHAENIGMHYYQTLMAWRNNLLSNKSKVLTLGFDEKFIRTWEYYFVYCAAGFKSRTLGVYQLVLSRPGNLKALRNPHEGSPASR